MRTARPFTILKSKRKSDKVASVTPYPSTYRVPTDSADHFQPCQILYLEHHASRLYTEVVQIIRPRQMCWSRPLMLVKTATEPDLSLSQPSTTLVGPVIYDLRQAPDLVWPIALFRIPLDTEVIPLVAQLQPVDSYSSEAARLARQQLNQFIQQVWRSHPDAFQPE